MIEYNTEMPKIEMREYGRHLQKLINYCVNIEDREERTRCANAIAEKMIKLFPELNNGEDRSKVWNHINIISDFKLDIDFPCEVISEKDLKLNPGKIPYPRKLDRFRVYGANLVKMIGVISRMDGGVEKDKMIFLVANQMKKNLISENSDSATDRRVFNDIKEISGGTIDIDPRNYRLNEYIGISNTTDNKKKKKK